MCCSSSFFFDDTAPTEIYTLSLHDALPISSREKVPPGRRMSVSSIVNSRAVRRSEEHTSELQSLRHLVCRLLLEKKKQNPSANNTIVTYSASESEHTHRRHDAPPIEPPNRS